MGKLQTYLFGRLNLIAFATNKIDFLRQTLNSGATLEANGYDWGFFDIREHTIENNFFFFARLVKSLPLSEEPVVDKQSRQIAKVHISDRAVCDSPFILHPKSGIIAYHPVENIIGKHQFRKNFAKLIEEANDKFFVDADVQVINDDIEFMKMLQDFSKITRLSIRLHPSNPSSRKVWDPTDRKMRELNAESYVQEFRSSEGLEIAPSSTPFGDIIMASDGYGEAKIMGVLEGQERTVSTKKNQIVKKIPPSDNPEGILNYLFDSFIKIWSRIDDE